MVTPPRRLRIVESPRDMRARRLIERDAPPAPPTVRIDDDQLKLILDAANQRATVSGAVVPGKTFGVLAEEWLARERSRLVAPENERRHIDHLRPLWALREGELTPATIKARFGDLRQPKGPLGPATLNKVRSTGKRIIRDAQESGEWHSINPFEVLRRVREPKPNHAQLSLLELARALPYLRPDRRMLAKLAFILGMRPGELLGCRKEDVDTVSWILHVRRSHGRDTTKTGKPRIVPIPPEAIPDMVEALKTPGPYLFPRADGSRQRSDTKLARVLKTALVKAGIVTGHRYTCRRCGHKEEHKEQLELFCATCEVKLWRYGIPKPVRFYDLRHSSATEHRKAGADPLAVKLALGHAALDPTDDIYTHLDEEFMRAELSKLKLPSAVPSRGQEGTAFHHSTERRTGFEPATPSLGSLGPSHLAASQDGFGPPVAVSGPPLPDSGPPVLLGVAEVARILRCNSKTVYRLIGAGQLPVIHIGNALRVSREALEAFIAKGGAR